MAFGLAACAPSGVVQVVSLAHGDYWVYTPPAVETAPALVFLHASGNGEAFARSEGFQASLDAAGLYGVFPMGGGEPGDDWRVGRNKDEIARDDRAFLDAVADDLPRVIDAPSMWLGGHSKGGAMTHDYACLGGDGFDGYVPLAGAMEDWILGPCTAPVRPIRQLQGRLDDHWPRSTADDPESSHKGVVESLTALQHNAECMAQAPVWQGDCEVWTECATDVRLCWHDGGHGRPAGWVDDVRRWIDAGSATR